MIQQAVSQGVIQILMALIGLLVAFVVFWIQRGAQKLKAETKKIKSDSLRQLTYDAINKLNDVIIKTVNQIEQTTAKDLRVAIKSGTGNKDELMNLAEQAYREIITQMGPEWMDVIYDEFGNAEKYIFNAIETAVYGLKKNDQAVAAWTNG